MKNSKLYRFAVLLGYMTAVASLNQTFSTKMNEKRRIEIIIKSFTQNIFIELNSSAMIQLYGSFCRTSNGLLFYSGDGLGKIQLVAENIYKFREKTKCSNDMDPFYEDTNKEKSFFITIVSQKGPANGTIKATVTDVNRSENKFRPKIRDSVGKHNIQIFLKNFTEDMQLNVGLRGDSMMPVYFSQCDEIEGELLINSTLGSITPVNLDEILIDQLNASFSNPKQKFFFRFYTSTDSKNYRELAIFFDNRTISHRRIKNFFLDDSFAFIEDFYKFDSEFQINLNVTDGSIDIFAEDNDSRRTTIGTNVQGYASFALNNSLRYVNNEIGNETMISNLYLSNCSLFSIVLIGKMERNSATIELLNVKPKRKIPANSFFHKLLLEWKWLALFAILAIIIILFICIVVKRVIHRNRRYARTFAIEPIRAFSPNRSFKDDFSVTWI